jgi:hypothetical protein
MIGSASTEPFKVFKVIPFATECLIYTFVCGVCKGTLRLWAAKLICWASHSNTATLWEGGLSKGRQGPFGLVLCLCESTATRNMWLRWHSLPQGEVRGAERGLFCPAAGEVTGLLQ